jgi:hypothetical protein
MLQYERRNERRKYENDLQALQRRMTRDLKKEKKEKKEEELKHRAEMIEQQVKFDEVVKQLRDNQHILRREEREAMERRIDEMERRHRADVENVQSRGDGGWGGGPSD